MGSQSIEFRYPPVSEVVVSTYFNPPLLDLRSEHIGLFWREIKEEFPVVRQQFPVGGPQPTADEPFPLPRYWFIADDEINLVQIQRNAFMFNWRRRDDAYPRFHADIKPNFDKYYGRFSEFIRTETSIEVPTVDRCELTYINVVERCDYWAGLQDAPKIIPSFSIPELAGAVATASEFDCRYAYQMLPDMQLNIGVRSGLRDQQSDSPVLMFEIRARGRLGQVTKSRADEWFERAHDRVVSCFLSLTNQEIQSRYWKRIRETR